MVNYYAHLFPQGGETKLTEEIFNRISEELNKSNPNHIAGTRLPPFGELLGTKSTIYNTDLPHADFVENFKTNNPNSPILTKIAEMEGKINFK